MKLIDKVIENMSGELAGKRDQFRLSIESKVDNPESTIESFNRQFQLGKVEKEAVAWACHGFYTILHIRVKSRLAPP